MLLIRMLFLVWLPAMAQASLKIHYWFWFRILVIDNKLVAAAKRVPAHVIEMVKFNPRIDWRWKT
jgi:hypothetical protein